MDTSKYVSKFINLAKNSIIKYLPHIIENDNEIYLINFNTESNYVAFHQELYNKDFLEKIMNLKSEGISDFKKMFISIKQICEQISFKYIFSISFVE